MAKRKGGLLIDVPVKFASQSANKESASIGVNLSRENADVSEVERFFCAKTITATLRLGNGDADQKRLPGQEDADEKLDGIFHVNSYSAKSKDFTFRLQGDHQKASALSNYAGKSGRLLISAVEEAESDDEEAEQE